MRAELLVSVLALVTAHRENSMVQHVGHRHVVSCVVTVLQRHFPVSRTVHLPLTADDDHKNPVVVVIHRPDVWVFQVTGPSTASVSPPGLEKINSCIIFTRHVKDITVQAEIL